MTGPKRVRQMPAFAAILGETVIHFFRSRAQKRVTRARARVTPVSTSKLLRREGEEGANEGDWRGEVCRFEMYTGRGERTGQKTPVQRRIACAAVEV